MSYYTYYYKGHLEQCLKMSENGCPIVIADMYTTGDNPFTDKIFELAMIKVTYKGAGESPDPIILDQRIALINPETPIPAQITKATGYSNEILKPYYTERKMFPYIKKFLDGCIICAYDTTKTIPFFSFLYKRYGLQYRPSNILDIKFMSRDINRDNISPTRKKLIVQYGIPNNSKYIDVRRTVGLDYDLFTRLVNEYKDIKIPDLSTKIKVKITGVSYWSGQRYDMRRIYVYTDYGTFWWSVAKRVWGEKKDKSSVGNVLDSINVPDLEKQVLYITNSRSISDLAKFKGEIRCY